MKGGYDPFLTETDHRLLADQLVALEVVDAIGSECVRRTLKKTS
jgi:hypothetical protein